MQDIQPVEGIGSAGVSIPVVAWAGFLSVSLSRSIINRGLYVCRP
jgi:hypothetical protein